MSILEKYPSLKINDQASLTEIAEELKGVPDEVIAIIASDLDLKASEALGEMLKNRELTILRDNPWLVELDDMIKICELTINSPNCYCGIELVKELKKLKEFRSKKAKTLLNLTEFNRASLNQILEILAKFTVDNLKSLKAQAQAQECFKPAEFFENVFELALLYKINFGVVSLNDESEGLSSDIPEEIFNRNLDPDFVEINAYCVKRIILTWIELGEVDKAVEFIKNQRVNFFALLEGSQRLAELGYLKESIIFIDKLSKDMQGHALSRISSAFSDYLIDHEDSKGLAEFSKNAQGDVLVKIIRFLIEKGEHEKARKVAKHISDKNLKIEFLKEIVASCNADGAIFKAIWTKVLVLGVKIFKR